jgi:hypothetical protein
LHVDLDDISPKWRWYIERLHKRGGPPPLGSKATGPTDPWLRGSWEKFRQSVPPPAEVLVSSGFSRLADAKPTRAGSLRILAV